MLTIALWVISLSLLLLAAERLSDFWLSGFLGQMLCGDAYMKPVDGYVSERSCGFKTPFHLFVLQLYMLIGGIILLITSVILRVLRRRRSEAK